MKLVGGMLVGHVLNAYLEQVTIVTTSSTQNRMEPNADPLMCGWQDDVRRICASAKHLWL